MRIIGANYEHVWHRSWANPEGRAERTGESTIETRILFNRFETKLIGAVLWLRNWWFETVTCRLGRVLCRAFRRHNLTCRGRRDHTAAGGLIDPGRWRYWPRR